MRALAAAATVETREPEEREAHAVSELAAVRLHSVDVLRAIAALAVVFFHMPPVGWDWLRPLQRTGYVGVNLFVVISGFAIHYVWAARGDASRFHVGAFWRRRLWRLYPTYIGIVAIAAVYALATHDVTRSMTRYWPLGGAQVPDPILIVSQLLLVTAGVIAVPFVEVSWTLGLELQLYAIYSAFARRLRAIGAVRLTLGALAIALLWRFGSIYAINAGPPERVVSATKARVDELFLLGQVPGRWFEWMLGLLAAEAWFGRVRLPALLRRPELGVAVVVAAYLMTRHPVGRFSLGGHGIVLSEVVLDPLFGVGFFVLINWLIRLELRRVDLLRGRLASAVGAIGVFSYSLYLLHVTAISVYSHVFRVHGKPPPAPWYLGAFGASLLAAWVYFRLVESRFLRAPPQRTPAASSSVAPRQV